jgi:hypothetical protein
VADWLEAERAVDRQICALAAARMRERLEAGVEIATRKLAALRRRVPAIVAGAESEFSKDVEKLAELKEALRRELFELGEQGRAASRKALERAEIAWNELGETMQRIGARAHH